MSTLLMISLLATAFPMDGVRPGPRGLTFGVRRAGRPVTLVAGLTYQANDSHGLVFRTRQARRLDDGQVEFALAGPGAPDAKVTARLTPIRDGCTIDWTISYTGAPRQWNPWTSGFRFTFGLPVTGAQTRPVIRWVKPTGRHPWEVAGDTPYPDTECQLREVFFGDIALVMVSPRYDPDWLYGGRLERVRFWKCAPPKGRKGRRHIRMTWIATSRNDLEPNALAARAAGRPVAMTLTTPHVGNLFEPGEWAPIQCRLRNVSDQPQRIVLDLEAWTYQGRRLLQRTETRSIPVDGSWIRTYLVRPSLRGVIFVAARLRWNGGETASRMTLGVLPVRPASAPRPDSPFGMAAMIANPERYPDQPDPRTVLRLMQRIGVRWIRGGWFPFKSRVAPEEEKRVRLRVRLLREYGILPHVQLGSRVPAPDAVDAFKRRVAAAVERFRWVSPYIEIGNELNHHLSARDYVARMLRPVHDAMRQVYPEGKVMSMGLGGVQKKWLDAFVAAGGMDLIDVLSVHPGCHPRAPEFWEGWRGWVFRSQMLDAMQAARTHGGKAVWITEAYAPTPPGRSGLDVRTAADYLVRTYVCALALGVQVIEWYQFQDGVWCALRPRPDDVEYNFGIVYTDLTPKPAYVAYAAMTEQLEGAQYQSRLDLGADDLYAVRFVKDGQPLDVVWSYREKHETDLAWWPPKKFKHCSRRPAEPWTSRWKKPVAVTLPAADRVSVTDLMGNTRWIQPTHGQVTLSLTGSPIYVRGLGDIPRRDSFWPPIGPLKK